MIMIYPQSLETSRETLQEYVNGTMKAQSKADAYNLLQILEFFIPRFRAVLEAEQRTMTADEDKWLDDCYISVTGQIADILFDEKNIYSQPSVFAGRIRHARAEIDKIFTEFEPL